MRCWHHYKMHLALIPHSIRTSISGRGWDYQRTSWNHWCPCHHHHLPCPMTWWVGELLILTSPSDTPSSIHCIQSSTLEVPAEDWAAFLIPLGHPGPLAFDFFSITASAIAQKPSWTVLTVASTYAGHLAQLTECVKLNLTSLVLPKGNPSLFNHLPKKNITSPGPRITALVIYSSRSSWNMSAINDPLHAWEGGGWSPFS